MDICLFVRILHPDPNGSDLSSLMDPTILDSIGSQSSIHLVKSVPFHPDPNFPLPSYTQIDTATASEAQLKLTSELHNTSSFAVV